ncbi:PIR protein [Plasmodium vivax]|uniref:VIR protein n=1 Tax=Plasmodium vivax TaxID=5855 RepID=A0A565A6E9_PLAVI|nr:PIR protein [Plasmodium vivax]
MDHYLDNIQLGNLRTIHYYYKLDKGRYGCEYFPFYDAATRVLDSYHWRQKDSDKILRALCYAYKNILAGYLDNDICNFLYFWLGNILLEKLVTKELFHEVILKLFNTLVDDKKDQICELPHSLMLKEEFKDFKLIFDCSEDYKSYREQYINLVTSCNNDYKEHLDTHIRNYNHFYDKCKVENLKESYCTAFDKYFPEYSSYLLSQFKCRLETKHPTVDQLEEYHKITQEQPRGQQMIGGLQRGEKFSVEPGVGVSLVEHHSPSGSYVNRVDSQMGSNSLPSVDTPSTITSKSITGAVSVAGALVPSYLLYNYTPAGNLINKLLGRTTRMNHNPLMEAQLMNNLYQPEGFNSERSGYNISYRPV